MYGFTRRGDLKREFPETFVVLSFPPNTIKPRSPRRMTLWDNIRVMDLVSCIIYKQLTHLTLTYGLSPSRYRLVIDRHKSV